MPGRSAATKPSQSWLPLRGSPSTSYAGEVIRKGDVAANCLTSRNIGAQSVRIDGNITALVSKSSMSHVVFYKPTYIALMKESIGYTMNFYCFPLVSLMRLVMI